MYAPAYGYGPGNPSAPFPPNPNGAPPQPHTPHQVQVPIQPGQQPQHMMYNPQQYASGGVGPHQSPYGGQGQGMPPNAGAMGMLQNNGGNVPAYQTPYSSSPYGGNMPTTSGANMSFIPGTSNVTSFPMNNMNSQHQGQRMQPPPTSSTPTQPGPRAPTFGNVPHNTPPSASQAQFSAPQNPGQAHLQTTSQVSMGSSILTPQTPNFSPGSQGGNSIATPLSPGSEIRERDRVTVLLEINRELLFECMRLNPSSTQPPQNEPKKDDSTTSPDGTEKEKTEGGKDKEQQQEKVEFKPTKEYFEYMRRLQCNLAYLAATADRSHKPSSQIPAHPTIMSAPPPSTKPSTSTSSPTTSPLTPKTDKKLEDGDGEDRLATIQELYRKLQALFPGVDPKTDSQQNAAARAQAQMQAQKQAMQQQQAQSQGQGQVQSQQGQAQSR